MILDSNLQSVIPTYTSVTKWVSQFNQKWLSIWKHRVGEQEANRRRDEGAKRGGAVHRMIEQYIESQREPSSDEPYIEYFNQIVPIIDARITDYKLFEHFMCSPTLRLKGKLDLIADYNHKLSVIDFKTSYKKKYNSQLQSYWLQVVCYALMWYELTKIEIENCVLIIAVEGSEPQVFVKSVQQLLPLFEQKYKQHPP